MEVNKIYGQCKTFNREEEIELCKKMHSGDKDAENKLFRSIVPWAIKLSTSIAYHCYSSAICGSTLDDVRQAGLMGLVEGLKRFDHTRGFRLTTYISYWVRKECLATIWDNRAIKIPRNFVNKLEDIPGMKRVVSLDSILDSHKEPYQDYYVSAELVTIEEGFEEIEKKDTSQLVYQCMKDLTDRECEILKGRSNGLTLKELGNCFGITKERIRQIQNEALRKLKKRDHNKRILRKE